MREAMVMAWAGVLLASQVAKAVDNPRPPFVLLEDEAPVRVLVEEVSSLKDPFSVRFRNLSVRTMHLKDPDRISLIYCGELNAKNSMGAYAGWSRFIATSIGKTVHIAKDGYDFDYEFGCRDAPNFKPES